MKNTLCILGCLLLASCASSPNRISREYVDKHFPVKLKNPVIPVARVTTTITADGKLDEADWGKAKAYELVRDMQPTEYISPKRLATLDNTPFQKGRFKVLYDDKNIYVAVMLEDTDVAAFSTTDQTQMFKTGDTIELFFKSRKAIPHWQLYAAPNGKRATLIQYGLGEYCFDYFSEFKDEFKYGVTVQGTLNHYQDTDKGFILECVVPIKILEELTGVKVDNNGQWVMQVARYNYTASCARQYSTFPATPGDFYQNEYYADLVFEASTEQVPKNKKSTK